MLEWLTVIRSLSKRMPPPSLNLSEPAPAHSLLVSGETMLTHQALGGRTWCVTKFPFMIGREADARAGLPCDLILSDTEPFQVSRAHCSILWVPSLEGFYVQDLGSKLGTCVNGIRLGRGSSNQTAPLRKGPNELLLGNEKSLFRFDIRLPKSLG